MCAAYLPVEKGSVNPKLVMLPSLSDVVFHCRYLAKVKILMRECKDRTP